MNIEASMLFPHFAAQMNGGEKWERSNSNVERSTVMTNKFNMVSKNLSPLWLVFHEN